MSQQEDCPFCQIARGEMETDMVHEEENVVAFEDMNPSTPVHVLVVPREHVAAPTELQPERLKELVDVAQTVAEKQGVAQSGYAMRINQGEDAGQEVEHLHLHVMGGRGMGMP